MCVVRLIILLLPRVLPGPGHYPGMAAGPPGGKFPFMRPVFVSGNLPGNVYYAAGSNSQL